MITRLCLGSIIYIAGTGLTGEFPSPHWPYICNESEYKAENFTCTDFSGYSSTLVGDALTLGVILCFVGLVESLLTLLLVGERTETVGDSNRE